MKTLRVTLDIDVDDLSKDQRKILAKEQECKERDLPTLADAEAQDLAYLLIDGIGTETSEEMFAGSDLYVRFTDAIVVTAEWLNPSR